MSTVESEMNETTGTKDEVQLKGQFSDLEDKAEVGSGDEVLPSETDKYATSIQKIQHDSFETTVVDNTSHLEESTSLRKDKGGIKSNVCTEDSSKAITKESVDEFVTEVDKNSVSSDNAKGSTNGSCATSHDETSSSNTETCSEEESSENDSKDDSFNLWNNISTLMNGRHKKSTSKKGSEKLLVTSFTLENGSVINIDKRFLQQPIVLELGNILDAFLKKVQVKSELSEMLYKTDAKNSALSAKEDLIHNLSKNCKQLEKINNELRLEIKQLEDKLESHDQGAKRAITRLHKDCETKVNEMAKKCSIAENEKQSSVMNFARREKELIDLKKQKDSAEQFAKAAGKDKEKALAQLKQLKTELSKLKNAHDKKENATTVQTKEIEKMKEEISSQAIKVRWAQNKLKSEVESHKETKEKCDKMVLEIQHAKEETEQIRKNCQEMIKTYQESEEIKSNALDIELSEKKEYISTLEKKSEELNSNFIQKVEEANQLQMKLDGFAEETQNLKVELAQLQQEKIKSEHVMHEYEEMLCQQKATATHMNEKMQDIFDLQGKVEDLNTTISNLNDALHESVLRRDSALNDVACIEQKEQELLEFTEKVSSKNTQLTVQLEELNCKFIAQGEDLDLKANQIISLQARVDELTSTKEEEKKASFKSHASLNTRLEEKERTICQLLLQLEELKDEMRTVKRKNAASIKDLTRQLNQVKRKAENAETLSASSFTNSANHSADGGSMGSRASSVTSLDKVHVPYLGESHSAAQCEHISIPETAISGPDSLDRQMLIERIVRLQQIHAKKNEKIDFLNEHVHQLVTALQKKQRLIQHYIMREESGALAPPRERHDQKRHGLTLDLSIEINQKMQSVLEDTLLKNITLKESLETLGHEIQRLQSQ